MSETKTGPGGKTGTGCESFGGRSQSVDNVAAIGLQPKGGSALKAIRAKCLDCAGGMPSEVRGCHISRCALHPFRMGKRPKKAGQSLSVEAKTALLARLGGDRAPLQGNQDRKAASDRDSPCVPVGAPSGVQQ